MLLLLISIALVALSQAAKRDEWSGLDLPCKLLEKKSCLTDNNKFFFLWIDAKIFFVNLF
jgi:hypothetical protein